MPKKKSLSIKLQRKLLNECIVRGKENPQLQVILDCGNTSYYINRCIELLYEAKDMSPKSTAALEKFKLVQILINIVRAECIQNHSKNMDAKDRKP